MEMVSAHSAAAMLRFLTLSFMCPDFFSDPLFFLPQEIEPIPEGLDDVKLLWKQFHRWSCFSYWC
jgi:hypothetical protein